METIKVTNDQGEVVCKVRMNGKQYGAEKRVYFYYQIGSQESKPAQFVPGKGIVKGLNLPSVAFYVEKYLNARFA